MFDNTSMDALICPYTGDYTNTMATGLQNAVYLRLETERGSWWADPNLGSRYHLLRREKNVTRVTTLAKQYGEEALSDLVPARAESVTVTVEKIHQGLWVHIQVIDLSNQRHFFKKHVSVA